MTTTWLRNAWYVAGFSDEFGADRPLARTLPGEPLVCGEGGALADRCPHCH